MKKIFFSIFIPRNFAFLTLFSGMVLFGVLFPTPAHAAYIENQLVDNGVFLSSNQMDQTAIQSFLAGKKSFLATYTTYSGRDNATVPAAQIIMEAAHDYGVNPQVIMATMQKEQSLITASQPLGSQLNYAMGYACPDGGTCGYTGFYNQVANGTWQLRFNFERAGGNNSWWNSNISYACSGSSPITFYTPGLYPSNTVSFIDGGGAVYKTFKIVNAATAALYCYTPHAYPGDSNYYYSGSYNFAISFDNWGWNLRDAPYAAQYYSQSVNNPTIAPTQSTSVYIMYQNTGALSWYDDASIGTAPQGSYPVHLATSHDLNRPSEFSDTSWTSSSRPATQFAAVYESDGSTLSSNQHVVLPGQIVKFTFNLSPKSSTAFGSHTEFFTPVAEGSSSQFNDTWTNIQPTVSQRADITWKSQTDTQPSVLPSQSKAVSINFTNSGNIPLYDDQSIGGAPAGSYPTHLATACPLNQPSQLADSTWVSNTRPAVNFSAVYNSDGTTISSNQHVAQPGQIIKYTFTLDIPNGYAAGNYMQCFQPIQEGTLDGFFPNLGVNLSIIVPQAMVIKYTQLTPNPQMISGQPSSVAITYQNVGNETIPGTSTINANSAFQAASWTNNGVVNTITNDLPSMSSATTTLSLLAPTVTTSTITALNLTIQNGTQLISGSDQASILAIVVPATYNASYLEESAYPSLTYGQSQTAFFRYKNNGNVPWLDDISLSSSLSRNPLPVHLATSHSINRNSGFAYQWTSSNRPTVRLSAVYEADNQTAASNQHVVQPGQIGEYSFIVSPASSVNPGTYREFFQPILEGSSTAQFNDTWTFLDVNLLAPKNSATFSSLSGYPSVTRGSSAQASISYVNTGNTTWYDDVSLSSAPAANALNPIHFATTSPMNRNSTFGSRWPSLNRPNIQFSAVYEPDGKTLAGNQHIVQPGQIATFTFSISASSTLSPGVYREYFQPIPEGSSSWNMGGTAWIDIYVNP